MEFDEQVELVARIYRSITNPDMSGKEKLDLATKWLGAAVITADKWGIPVSEVLDIDDKLSETESQWEPEEKSREQKIFWDYIHETNQFEHIEE